MTVEAFWDWSLKTYERDGVAAQLLALQDRLGLNVNILLWCCWSAERGQDVAEPALRRAMDLTAQWSSEVTGRLRAARRALKSPSAQPDAPLFAALKAGIAEAELKAERVEQLMLAKIADALRPRRADAYGLCRRALSRYAKLAGAVERKGFSTLLLDDLARAVFPRARAETRR
jgi:uncharacterized protein (TIGR02444 family)